MLVTMKKDPVISLTLPGKVQTYMAAGKPILGAIDGETQNVIQDSQCGFCCEAENFEQLAKNVRLFMKEKDKNEYGKRAYFYYMDTFSKDKVINCLIECL